TNALISVGEYAEKGMLLEYLQSNCINLNYKTRLNFLLQISRDLQSLFNSGFVTSVLTGNSFCVKNDQTVVFTDFLCVVDKNNLKPYDFKFYAPQYDAPELSKNRIYTEENLALVPDGLLESYTSLMNKCLNNDPNL
ncbi:15067_t:CDS:2, partial [Racocetra fulgida]